MAQYLLLFMAFLIFRKIRRRNFMSKVGKEGFKDLG